MNVAQVSHKVINGLSAAGLASLLVACTSAPPKLDDPFYSPTVVPQPKATVAQPGSLYRPGFNMVLFDDRRAAQVGDIITVLLNERTISSKSSETKIDKTSETTMNEANVLGTNLSFSGTGALSNLSMLTDPTVERAFNGKAEADQSNRLEGSISVTVSDVLPNGNLVVKGEKWIELNQGKEFIRVSGIIRQDDISPTNTISSQKLANARISYSGTGDLADANKRGWLDKLFSSPIWPF